jgi:hypothetical protein
VSRLKLFGRWRALQGVSIVWLQHQVSRSFSAFASMQVASYFFLCAGDGSVYILSASLGFGLALQHSVALQPLFPLYSVAIVDENRFFVGSRGGFVVGVRCSADGLCVQDCGADLRLGTAVRTLSHTTCRFV